MQRAPNRHIDLKLMLLVCLACLPAVPGFAQSLGDVARWERARKQSQPPRPLYVYTNDDLARPQILEPEDRARFQALRKDSNAPSAQQAVDIPASVPTLGEIPLGDVARYYRLQKQIRQGQFLGDLPGFGQAPALAAPAIPKPPLKPTPARVPDLAMPRSVRVAKPAKRDEHPAVGKVRAARGDSLWRLAKRHLGSGVRWRQLATLNPQLTDPDFIRVGQWIRLPLDSSGSQVAKMFRVHKGDTLWKVARVEFGSGQAWTCVAQANPHLSNANLIYPGQTLAIPPRCTAAP